MQAALGSILGCRQAEWPFHGSGGTADGKAAEWSGGLPRCNGGKDLTVTTLHGCMELVAITSAILNCSRPDPQL